jgi:hypothetical protein
MPRTRSIEASVTAGSDTQSRSPWDTALALTSLSAAAIHFAVIDVHLDEGVVFGAFFALIAWGQALWALGLLIAPKRWLIRAGLIGNAVIVGTWVLSRTVGVPIGPQPWTPEAVGVADLISTVLEIGIVVGCAARLAWKPNRTTSATNGRFPAIALGLTLVLVTSDAIAAIDDHGHSDVTPAGHPHTATSAAAEEAHDGHRLVGGSGEPDLFQIAMIREAMKQYRDVHVAQAEGWRKEHQDWPEIGAHFYRERDWGDDSFPRDPGEDLLHPEYLMYSKFLTGHWKLVAVAYVVDQALYPEPPTDITGAIYHEHVWNCIVDDEELEAEDWGVISPEECEIMGGEWSPGGVWMTHVWLVDNPNGIFAEENPTLTTLKF